MEQPGVKGKTGPRWPACHVLLGKSLDCPSLIQTRTRPKFKSFNEYFMFNKARSVVCDRPRVSLAGALATVSTPQRQTWNDPLSQS